LSLPADKLAKSSFAHKWLILQKHPVFLQESVKKLKKKIPGETPGKYIFTI